MKQGTIRWSKGDCWGTLSGRKLDSSCKLWRYDGESGGYSIWAFIKQRW